MQPAVRTKAVRRWYFLALILALTVAVLARLLLLGVDSESRPWLPPLTNVLDNLVATVVVAIVVGLLVPFLFPSDDSYASIEVVDGPAIEDSIDTAVRDARQWHVRARTASYFARRTLPALQRTALAHKRSLTVKVQLLDPEDEGLMHAYARTRSNHPGAATRWTPSRVRSEIYWTILQAALTVREAPRVSITVGLASTNWVMSLDLADSMALVTGQNKGEPALRFDRASDLFSGWCDDFDSSFESSRRILVQPAPCDRVSLRTPSEATLLLLRGFFEGHGLTTLTTNEDLRAVIAQADGGTNYE